jgi:ATP-dependent RNA helicase DeaD
MSKFREIGLTGEILKAVEEIGFVEPSEIQSKSIPPILEGKDIIGESATGSGKTLAFATGIIQKVKKNEGIQGLVLTPTRELAEQVAGMMKRFSKFKNLRVTSIYGGVGIHKQIDDIKKSEIIVGTPGRLLDHLSRETINLENLKVLVLDEADRMIDMGFIEDVEKIISQCPIKRQTLLFSATISGDINHISKKHMKNPIIISVKNRVDPKKLKQTYYDIEPNLKFSLLVSLLKKESSGLVMVFCNTQRNTDFIAKNLKFSGINALAIHGGFSQEKRKRAMDMFNSKKTSVLVCTDVAARGLDIQGVSHVYNYDIPREENQYLHRIGRTARAGKEGKAINLVSSRDYDNFSKILNKLSLKIEREKTERIDRVRIRWMEEKKGKRGEGAGRSFGRGRSGGNSYGRRSEGKEKSGGRRKPEGRMRGGNKNSGRSFKRNASNNRGVKKRR